MQPDAPALGRPPAVAIRLALEGRPAVSIDVAGADEELRLREHVAANLDLIVEQIAAEFERVLVPREPAVAAAIESAGRVVARNGKTIGSVAQRAAAGDARARAWIVWALLSRDESDPRIAAVSLYLSERHPVFAHELLDSLILEAVLGGEAA